MTTGEVSEATLTSRANRRGRFSSWAGRLRSSRARRLRSYAGPTAAGLLLVWVYFGYARTGPYQLSATELAVVYAILALGMYVPVVMGGYIDLAYNAYYAAGAYSVALIGTKTSLPVLLGVVVGALVAAVLALVLALATSRLSGFHLAIATMVVGIAAATWLGDSASVTGGIVGLGGIPGPSIFGHELAGNGMVVSGLALTWFIAVSLTALRRGVVGTALRLQREHPTTAESYGISTRLLQVTAMALGAAIASVAGGLFAMTTGFILPNAFQNSIIFIILFVPFIGGAASPWGAVLGAAIITYVTQELSFGQDTGELMFGLATLAIFLVAPAGLLGLPKMARGWVRGGGGGDRG